MRDIPKGYKQTEVGVIPEDWEVQPLFAFADVKTGPFGSALHERDYVSDGTPIITVEHLSEQRVVHENLPLVSNADKNRLSSYSLRSGDIVFSRVGSVDRNAIIRDTEEGWLFSGRLLRIRVLRSDVHPLYLSYHFHSEPFKQRVRAVAVGQTMASLNTQILKGVYTVLPTNAEQHAIASALSDTDALIESLEQLIAKKRNLKQATLQLMLYPKKGDVVRLLREISTLKGRIGWQGLKQTEFTYNEEEPFLITGMNFKDGAIRWNEVYHISESRYEMAKDIQLSTGDVLMTKDGTIGKVLYIDSIPPPKKASLNSHLLLFRPIKGSYNAKYLYYQLGSRRFKDFIEQSKSGTTFFGMSQASVSVFPVLMPPIEEQDRIAQVLSDMDSEIDALETRLDKTRAIKQGIMQELLTGMIRLV